MGHVKEFQPEKEVNSNRKVKTHVEAPAPTLKNWARWPRPIFMLLLF